MQREGCTKSNICEDFEQAMRRKNKQKSPLGYNIVVVDKSERNDYDKAEIPFLWPVHRVTKQIRVLDRNHTRIGIGGQR